MRATYTHNAVSSSQCGDETIIAYAFSLAVQAVNAMGLLAKGPMASEDKLLVSDNAASNILTLAAKIALEVRLISSLKSVTVHQSEKSLKIREYSSLLCSWVGSL